MSDMRFFRIGTGSFSYTAICWLSYPAATHSAMRNSLGVNLLPTERKSSAQMSSSSAPKTSFAARYRPMPTRDSISSTKMAAFIRPRAGRTCGASSTIWNKRTPRRWRGRRSAPGQDLQSAKDTLWGVVNAVSYYVDHVRAGSAGERLSSAWFGAGSALKEKAWAKANTLIS
jgi:hypothetical protein